MTRKEIDAKKNELRGILQKKEEVIPIVGS